MLGALRTAVIALVAAIGFAVAGTAFSAWAFIPAALSFLFAVVDAFLVRGRIGAETAEDIKKLITGPPIRVRDIRPHEFGVDKEVLPEEQKWAYVERDFENELAEAMDRALKAEGPALVMLSGPSKSGKTRAALQSLQRSELGSAWLIEPRDGSCVEQLLVGGVLPKQLSPLVIWLDDIERYASAEAGGLQASVLRDPRYDRPCLLLATEGGRGQQRQAEGSDIADPVEGLRRIAAQIEIDVELSDSELRRISEAYSENFVSDAKRIGLGRRMVAADEVKRKLMTGRHDSTTARCREGLAVLEAAINWRRAGAQSSLGIAQLSELYCRYLPADQDPSEDLFRSGLQWARMPLTNTDISLLRKGADDANCFEPYDLAVEVADSQRPRLDEDAIREMAAIASHRDQGQMGLSCYERGQVQLAADLFGAVSEAPHTGLASIAAFNLGVLLDGQGRTAEAETAYKHAEEKGSPNAANNLGVIFGKQGRIAEAEAAFKHAEEKDHPNAAFNLGVLLDKQGRTAEAETAYKHAEEKDHPNAAFNLGVLLDGQGRTAEAETAYKHAEEKDHPGAAFNLGVLLDGQGRTAEAEAAYKHAEEKDHPGAANNLGVLLDGQGRTAEAEAALKHAEEKGSPNAAFNLGVLLDKQGRTAEAGAAYKRAEESATQTPPST
jgi:Flp pilus assembly protein TadD